MYMKGGLWPPAHASYALALPLPYTITNLRTQFFRVRPGSGRVGEGGLSAMEDRAMKARSIFQCGTLD